MPHGDEWNGPIGMAWLSALHSSTCSEFTGIMRRPKLIVGGEKPYMPRMGFLFSPVSDPSSQSRRPVPGMALNLLRSTRAFILRNALHGHTPITPKKIDDGFTSRNHGKNQMDESIPYNRHNRFVIRRRVWNHHATPPQSYWKFWSPRKCERRLVGHLDPTPNPLPSPSPLRRMSSLVNAAFACF